MLTHTHAGLVLRAVGDAHEAGHALGYPVIAIRYAAVAFGGAMAGLAGAYMSLAYNSSWSENMTAGRGWIALALVVFALVATGLARRGRLSLRLVSCICRSTCRDSASRSPRRPSRRLPYLATILVLVLISSDQSRIKLTAPTCLGRSFHASV